MCTAGDWVVETLCVCVCSLVQETPLESKPVLKSISLRLDGHYLGLELRQSA